MVLPSKFGVRIIFEFLRYCFFSLYLCLSISLSVTPSVWLCVSICLSVIRSVVMSFSLYISVCQSLYICHSICLAVCLCLSVCHTHALCTVGQSCDGCIVMWHWRWIVGCRGSRQCHGWSQTPEISTASICHDERRISRDIGLCWQLSKTLQRMSSELLGEQPSRYCHHHHHHHHWH